MNTTQNIALLKKCEDEVKKSISSIKNLLDPMKDPDFKLMVIKSKDALKQYAEQLNNKLTALENIEQEENKMTQAVSKVIANTKLLLEKTDAHIASLLFDTCNECLKQLYKAINENNCADSSCKALATTVIETLIDLRENLIAYL